MKRYEAAKLSQSQLIIIIIIIIISNRYTTVIRYQNDDGCEPYRHGGLVAKAFAS